LEIRVSVFCVSYMPSDNDVNFYYETLCEVNTILLHYCKVGTVIFAGDLPETLMLNSTLKPAYPRTKRLSFCPRLLKIIMCPLYTRILTATHIHTSRPALGLTTYL